MSPLATAIEGLIAEATPESGPGFIVGVQRGDDIVFKGASGLASLELGYPLSVDHLVPICSITKSMSSFAALIAAEQGLLDLDVAIGAYLPELPAIAQRPTLRQLMNHTSGLRCFIDSLALDPLRSPRPPRFGLRALCALQSVNAAPGARQTYSSTGHFLLSLALERATGLDFAAASKALVFERLSLQGIHQSAFPDVVEPNSPCHYERDGVGRYQLVTQDRFETLGEGGYYATVTAILGWARAIRTEPACASAATWAALKTPPPLPNGQTSSYALGLQSTRWRGVDLFGHGGGSPGIATYFLTAPAHDLDVVVFANGDLPAADLALKILAICVGEAALEPRPAPADARAHAHLVGRTFAGSGMVVEFVDVGGELRAAILGAPPLPLQVSTEPDVDFTSPGLLTDFRIKDLGDRIFFAAYGEDAVCDVLPTPELSNLDGLDGVFQQPDLRTRFEFHRRDGRVHFEYWGQFGFVEGTVEPLGGDRARLVWPPAIPFYFVLRLDRVSDRITGFHLSTTRSRDLPFERVDAGVLGCK